MGKDFAGNGEKGSTSVIATDQLVTFSLPKCQYDSACPVLGEMFRVPDLIDDVRQPRNDIIALGFKHFRRNLADARGSVIFQQLHSFFTSFTVTGLAEHSRDGSAACEEASRSRSKLTGGWWSKLLKCSIHRDAAALIVDDMAFPIPY